VGHRQCWRAAYPRPKTPNVVKAINLPVCPQGMKVLWRFLLDVAKMTKTIILLNYAWNSHKNRVCGDTLYCANYFFRLYKTT
jgi:hypothetical protein